MSKLKALLFEEEAALAQLAREQVEVIGDTIDDCLKIASKHFGKEIFELEYEVIKRGKKKLFFSEPYHIRVFFANPEDNLDELKALDEKLTGGSGKLVSSDLKELIAPKDVDAKAIIKNYRSGVYLAVFPPLGNGKELRLEDIMRKFAIRGINIPNESDVSRVLEEETGEFIRLCDAKLKPFAEAQVKVEISPDNMKAYVTLIPPKVGGRDVEVADVIYELKNQDISYGIKEDEIRKYVDEETYNTAFTAAVGDPPVKGKDAHIVYHIRTEKNIKLKEDAYGKVDYRELDLIENVVVGQLLAEKIPAEKGKFGRNLFNEILDTKDGEDIQLLQGKGTILTDSKLTAEVNGQAIFIDGKINVETILKITGDVSNKTGNITFLGSLVITGNIEDGFQVKASGNIEIYGTVQKAVVEADGDIIIRQGIAGKDEARVESLNGNIIAKFIQDATVSTDKNVVVQEVIMNSNVSAGDKIKCDGKKAQIIGGSLKAGNAIIAKNIGSAANPPTELRVGVNPKLHRQIEDFNKKKAESNEKMEQLEKRIKTLKARKEDDPESFTKDNEDLMEKMEAGVKKLVKRLSEYDKEIEVLKNKMEQSAGQGKVYFEKKMFGGVKVFIKDQEHEFKNEVLSKIIYLENDQIKQKPYVDPEHESSSEPKRKRGKGKVVMGNEGT